MENPHPIRAFTREELAEGMSLLGNIEKLIGSMPFSDAKLVTKELATLNEMFEDVLPGGFISKCEDCDLPIGSDEIGAHDDDNGVYLCMVCASHLGQVSEPQE